MAITFMHAKSCTPGKKNLHFQKFVFPLDQIVIQVSYINLVYRLGYKERKPDGPQLLNIYGASLSKSRVNISNLH